MDQVKYNVVAASLQAVALKASHYKVDCSMMLNCVWVREMMRCCARPGPEHRMWHRERERERERAQRNFFWNLTVALTSSFQLNVHSTSLHFIFNALPFSSIARSVSRLPVIMSARANQWWLLSKHSLSSFIIRQRKKTPTSHPPSCCATTVMHKIWLYSAIWNVYGLIQRRKGWKTCCGEQKTPEKFLSETRGSFLKLRVRRDLRGIRHVLLTMH